MSNESLLGKQFDEYRIDQPLGSGGMASVYRALDTRLKRYVALKVIAPAYRANADYTRRFEQEAQSIARLEHPNIVRLYRFGEADGLYYMAMQYLDGADLGSLIDGYRADGEVMSIADIVPIVASISAALDYAHSQGVIHRDVKPGNIMLDKQAHAFLTDFGLALLSDVGTRGEIFGSPHYIAPEQAISSANVVPQTDLYALGVTLFEMLTGELPFQGDDPTAVAMLHMLEKPPPPSRYNQAIPASIDQVVLRCLEKEAIDRYQTGRELSDALTQAAQSWQPDSISLEATARRPSLVTIPEKVSDLLQHVPDLPPIPAGLGEATVDSVMNKPPDLSIPTQKAALIRPVAKNSDWKNPLLFAGALFGVGLIVLVLALLAARTLAGEVANVPTAAFSPTITVTLMPSNTILPTFTETLLPTPTALVLAKTALPVNAPISTSSVIIPTTIIVPAYIETQPPTPIALSLATTAPPSIPPYIPPTNTSNIIALNTVAATPSVSKILPVSLALTFSSDKNWFAVANSSSVTLSVANMVFSKQDQTLGSSDWAVSAVKPGDCLRIYQDDQPPPNLPTACTRAIDYPGSKSNRNSWFKGDQVVTITLSISTSISSTIFPLSFTGDRQLFTLENSAFIAFPLNKIIFSRQGRTMGSSDWGVSMLQPGDCLRLTQDDNPPKGKSHKSPKDSGISCSHPIDYIGAKADRDFWLQDNGVITIGITIAP